MKIKKSSKTYRVHGLQHSVTVDIHVHGPPTLNTSIHHAIPRICKTQVFFLEHHHCVSDGELDLGQVVSGGGGGEDVALVCVVVFRTRDGFVDGVDEGVVDEAECGTRVHDGSVVGTVDGLPVDGGGCGFDLPETLAVVDGGVGGFCGAGGG
jgi:hypothetical protein